MFKSKVVIVTGSSGGIGAGTAVKFASEGANVVIHGRKEAALKEVKEKCLKAGGGNTKVHICIGDLSKDETRQKIVNEAIREFGKIDVLVNNAGLYDESTLIEGSMDVYDKLFDVNVRSVIALTQLATPHLIKSKGNIVNISSELGIKVVAWAGVYAMTKRTLDHFTKCLALDLGPKGVRVNGINPSHIPETDVLSRAGIHGDEKEGYAKMAADSYPLRRTGTVDEITDGILFVASDKAKFVTGVLFPVDGGSVAGSA
jgi:NAD(P)-dependent dehydrogenase (short-subunit alcohol dehydrogenase family)